MRAKVVTVTRWYAQNDVNHEESEQNEADGMKKGADSTGEVTHVKERLVICNEEDRIYKWSTQGDSRWEAGYM